MLHHIGFVLSTVSFLFVSLSPVPEGSYKRAETNRLARITPRTSFLHAPPPPASVPLPTNEHVCLPCPDAAAPRLKASKFLLVDPGGEERLHSERHAHSLGSQEALPGERDERKAGQAARQWSRLVITAAYRQALVKMKFETAALIPFVPSPYPRVSKPAKINLVQKTPWYSKAYKNAVSAFVPPRDHSIQSLKSSFSGFRPLNSSFGGDLHIGSRDIATNFKSALTSLSVPDVHRHWQTVSRVYATVCQASVLFFDSHLRDYFTRLSSWLAGIPRAFILGICAVSIVLVLVMIWFGFRWWRSRASLASPSPPSPPSDDTPDVPSESALVASRKPTRADRPKAPKSDTRTNKHKARRTEARTEPVGGSSRASPPSPAHARRLMKAGVAVPGFPNRPRSPLESVWSSSSTQSRLSDSVARTSTSTVSPLVVDTPSTVSPLVVDTPSVSDSTLSVSDSLS